MKNIIPIIVPVLLIMAFFSCESTDNDYKSSQIVLTGYLYQGKVIDSIRITKTVTFESSDTIYPPINDAQVTLTVNNKNYVLANIGNGYYNCPDTNLIVNEKDQYSISAIYNGHTITSSTVIPQIPTGITISKSVLSVDTGFTFTRTDRNSGFVADTNVVTINWDNPANDYFYIELENADSNSVSLIRGTGTGRFPMGIMSFRSEPFRGNTYTISRTNVNRTGKHKVKIYRVNQEYADLFRNRQQDSRNLSEPITNINNGLGIFTGFSFAETTFYVEIKIKEQ